MPNTDRIEQGFSSKFVEARNNSKWCLCTKWTLPGTCLNGVGVCIPSNSSWLGVKKYMFSRNVVVFTFLRQIQSCLFIGITFGQNPVKG